MIARFPLPYLVLQPVAYIIALIWMIQKPQSYGGLKFRMWSTWSALVLFWVGGVLIVFGYLWVGQFVCIMVVTYIIGYAAYLFLTNKVNPSAPRKRALLGLFAFAGFDVWLIFGFVHLFSRH